MLCPGLMHKVLASVSLASALLAFSSAASATDAPEAPATSQATPKEEEGSRKEWYGYQTLLVDAAAGASFAFAGAAEKVQFAPAVQGAWVVLGLSSYAVVSPLVHVLNHEPGRGIGSLAIRLAMPAMSSFVGFAASSGCNPSHTPFNFCRLEGWAIGMGVGMLAASIVDASALAWKSAPKPIEKTSISPDVRITSQGAIIGATGRF